MYSKPIKAFGFKSLVRCVHNAYLVHSEYVHNEQGSCFLETDSFESFWIYIVYTNWFIIYIMIKSAIDEQHPLLSWWLFGEQMKHAMLLSGANLSQLNVLFCYLVGVEFPSHERQAQQWLIQIVPHAANTIQVL